MLPSLEDSCCLTDPMHTCTVSIYWHLESDEHLLGVQQCYPGCTESLTGSLLRFRAVPRVHQLATLVDGWCYCRHGVWSASPALRGGCTIAVSDNLRVGFHLL
ncbi:hypothetical protein LINGRAHAP2_LOCUS8360 [Linum grandiflorum]